MPIIRYFRNCNLKWTDCERLGPGEYRFRSVKKDGCYVITNSDLKSIKYHCFEEGMKPKIKRAKSLKIIGGEEVTEEFYKAELEEWRNIIRSTN